MSRLKTEKNVERIYNLRKQKKEIETEVRFLTEQVVQYLKQCDKRALKLEKYSCEYVKKTNIRLNIQVVKELIKNKVLPENIIERRTSNVLFVKAKKDIRLEGNKFIVE